MEKGPKTVEKEQRESAGRRRELNDSSGRGRDLRGINQFSCSRVPLIPDFPLSLSGGQTEGAI